MRTAELTYVGIKGSVMALDRATGEQVWATHLKGYDFVNVVLDAGRVFATCCGEIFCLEPLTGEVLWHNRLKGYGTGLATIATEAGAGCGATAVLAEKQRRNQAAATTAATTAAM